MVSYATVQDQFCSSYDKRKLCSYDIEFIDRPTRPLLHQTSRFLFIEKGSGNMKINGIDYKIIPNSFIAILPWETTEINVVDEALQFVKIIYNSDFISQSMKSTYNTSNDLLSILTPIGNYPVIYCTEEEAKIIKGILNEIKNETGVEYKFIPGKDHSWYTWAQEVFEVIEYLKNDTKILITLDAQFVIIDIYR